MRKMKYFIVVILCILSFIGYSQIPETFNYQAVIRNNSDELIKDRSVSVRISILNELETAIYTETHTVLSNGYGVINVKVGTGTPVLNSFSEIDWEGTRSIQIELDENGGSTYVNLGSSELLSVPFAIYAKDVVNKDDADSDPNNEIQDLNLLGSTLKITNNAAATEINLSPFMGTNTDEQTLNLNGDTLEISNGNSVVLPYDSSKWVVSGSDTYYNLGKVGIGTTTPNSKLEVKADASFTTLDTLFSVKDKDGNVVFAVFPDGAKVYVNETVKGNLGGFAVSGRGTTKGEVDYLTVTPDSTRIYVQESAVKGSLGGFAVSGRGTTKGVVNDYLFVDNDSARIYVSEDPVKGRLGGFAVSGRGTTKGVTNDYLQVTPDSTRIYVQEGTVKGRLGGFAVSGRGTTKGVINDYLQVSKDSTRIFIDEAAKGNLGGFAVSGRGTTKGVANDFFNISANIAADVISNESRVMWYPEKSALLAGELNVPSPDSVGEFSLSLGYRNSAIGDWSQAMGYQSIARGPYSTAIGFEAIADTSSFAFGTGSKALGKNSFAFGTKGVDVSGNVLATVTSSTGDFSFAFGLGSTSSGLGSFVMGVNSTASGDFSTALGFNTEAIGLNSMSMGVDNTSEGEASFTMGSGNTAGGAYSLAFGNQNETVGLASVAFGTGNSANGTQSLVAGYDNTASGKGAIAFGISNTVNGDGAFASGLLNQSTQTYATAFGSSNIASGVNSFAIGSSTQAVGSSTVAMGDHTIAAGDYSLAAGYYSSTGVSALASIALGHTSKATGTGSLAAGGSTESIGYYSTSLGYNTKSRAYGSLVIGQFNTTDVTSQTSFWLTVDPVFVIGIGTGTSARKDGFVVYQDGSAKINGDFNPMVDNTHDLGSSGLRWSDIFTNGAVTTTSDIRLKSNINNITYGLKDILKLRPVNFLWKDNPEKGVKLGLIAQEVQPIISEVVNVGDDENQTLGIRYSDLIPVLIKSIQEQQVIIEDQNKKNKELEDQLKEINEKLLLLEQKVK